MNRSNKLSFPVIFIALLGVSDAVTAQDPVEIAREHSKQHGAQILREFADLLSIPNVASDEVGIRRNAEFIRGMLLRRGVRVELLEVPGAPPVVFGELKTPGAGRTLGFYAHYDGQPADHPRWTNRPWAPTLYTDSIEAGGTRREFPETGEPIDPKWRIYARSAGDDKAPIVALVGALDALRNSGTRLTSNLKLFFEGEEEAGSGHLEQFLDKFRDKLDVDAWIICDGPIHQSRRPQLVFGVRGVTVLDITVYGATRYLHSGHYGNWAPNPAMKLARLLSSMKDESGRVLIKGFYDSAEPLGPAERAALTTVPNIDRDMRRELGLAETEDNNASLTQRLLLPSLNIRGMASATVGETARNVIPTTASASLDIRLVKGNLPSAMLDLVEAHIRGRGYHIVREEPDHETRLQHAKIAKIIRHRGYPAARTSTDLPIAKQVIRAAGKATAQPLILLPTLGGSLPLYLFTDDLRKPAIIAPIANHDNNQHAPDENLQLGNLWYGIDLMTALMTMPP